MSRIVVNVATDSWQRGQDRLTASMHLLGQECMIWRNHLPMGSPPHRQYGYCAGPADKIRPYAFKAYALKAAADRGHTTLLWADSSIVPIRKLDPLWAKIERDGVWISRNGWMNSEWTADEAYRDLFPDVGHYQHYERGGTNSEGRYERSCLLNATIPHVVATTFGLNVEHPVGRAFLDEYYRLASQTRAFCGPWGNTNAPSAPRGRNTDRPCGPCGPPTTLGHRHDQTAASVIAWRLGVQLSEPPEYFAYQGGETEKTILIAKGI